MENRGGARQGSGRKKGKEQKVTVSFRVTESNRDKVQQLREEGVDVTAKVAELIEAL